MTVSDSRDWVVVSNRATVKLHVVKHVQDILGIANTNVSGNVLSRFHSQNQLPLLLCKLSQR